MKKTTFLALCATTLSLLTGCGGGEVFPDRSPTPNPCTGTDVCVGQQGWTVYQNLAAQPQKKWTFLVYMNGANDLETYGVLNMNQMEQVGTTADVNIVTQYERIAGYDTTNGDWRSTRRYYVTKDSDTNTINSLLLSENNNRTNTTGSADMGRVTTLQEFIDWGVRTFPAERYCLVLWNHGAGWRSKKITSGRGISYSDTTQNHIDTIDIPRAIAHPNVPKWDVLTLDLSLMQMAEVAYELRNSATYIVGSEESPPGAGYPYDRFLTALAANPNMPTLDFAKRIVSDTLDYYGADSNTTQSVLDASKVGAIVPALDQLGTALWNVRLTADTQIGNARAQSERYGYPEYKDLLDFLNRISTTTLTTTYVDDIGVQSAALNLRNAVQAAILFNRNGTAHPNSHGLSLFIPTPFEYQTIDNRQSNGFGQRYIALSIAKDAPNWQQFIQSGVP